MSEALSRPIHLIWDDDGSPDGVIALLYFLKHPEVCVEAITVSYGQAHTAAFAELLPAMLARLNRSGIPVAVGREQPLEGTNTFPEPWRVPTDTFWGVKLPEETEPLHALPAAKLLLKVLGDSADPVTLFISGAHTNLAEVLRMDPGIRRKIAGVHVMGGALYVEGNIEKEWPQIPNQVAEWNIWADPLAASEVFSAGLPLHLTPLDATDQVRWNREDVDLWEKSGTPEGVLAAEILRWMLDEFKNEDVYLWDLLTAVHVTDPALCRVEKLHVQVNTQPGNEQGRTVLLSSRPPNVKAYLEPQAGAIKRRVTQVFDWV
jgi:purine nucleosidase/pyrimidine-specific ribonucleoside hydrolase